MKPSLKFKIIANSIKYVWNIDKKYFVIGFMFAIVCAIDPLYNILPLKIVLDMLSKDFSFIKCFSFFLCVLLFALLTNIFAQWYRNKYLPTLNLKVQFQTRKDVLKKTYNIDYANFDNPLFYDKYKLALNQIDNGISSIISSLYNFLAQILSVFTVGTIVLITDPILMILVIIQVSLTVVINMKQGKINYDFDVENVPQERKKQYVGRLLYLQDFIKDLKIFNFLELIFDWQNKCYKEKIKILNDFFLKKSLVSFLNMATNMILKICIYIYLAWSVYNGKNSLGDFPAMIAATVSLSSLLTNLVSIIPNMDKQCRYLNNLFYYINPQNNVLAKQTAKLSNELKFNNVRFTYPGTTNAVLNNISLNIKAGQKIAIVGKNGAGKSTLINLLMGLYKPESGNIVIDSHIYTQTDLPIFIENAGAILQNSKVYAFSIAENVLLHPIHSTSDITMVNNALEYAGLAEKVSLLPEGINTPLSTEFEQNGVQFSGGEIQKLALARVYASGKDLWIFDEPSSNLDPIAESEFYKKMFNAPENKTVVFVSHKMRSASLADKIFFMQDGCFIESGTHDELMKKKGKYYDFYMIQNSEDS